jgi:hypothetical protein
MKYEPNKLNAILQVLTATSLKITVFWNIAPCSLINVDRRVSRAYCLHRQGCECQHPDDGGSKLL